MRRGDRSHELAYDRVQIAYGLLAKALEARGPFWTEELDRHLGQAAASLSAAMVVLEKGKTR